MSPWRDGWSCTIPRERRCKACWDGSIRLVEEEAGLISPGSGAGYNISVSLAKVVARCKSQSSNTGIENLTVTHGVNIQGE